MSRISDSAEDRLGALSKEKAELLKRLVEERSRRSQEIARYPRDEMSSSPLLPTSWAQQRLWFIDELEGGSAGYNIAIALRLRGILDKDALSKALNMLLVRHEALRTVFTAAEGEPMQRVRPHGEFSLRTFDLSCQREEEREIEIKTHRIAEIHDKFDLRAGPLIRGRLLQVEAEEHVLLVTMHHIISDGWSMGVFFEELWASYSSQCGGNADSQSRLPIQYVDYVWWQRQWFRGELVERQLKYWRAKLADAAPELALPTDRPRPSIQSYRGQNVAVTIDAELRSQLKVLAHRHEMTLFMILYAGWAILLSRLSGQEDVVMGTPIANRQRPEFERLIGFFVNTLVLRVRVHGTSQLEEFLDQVKDTARGAYDHQDIPFERVVEALHPQRSLSRNPLFQVIFVLQNAPRSELRLPGLAVSLEGVVDEPSIFDLYLALEERGEGITGNLNYAADLFDRRTMERWVGYFVALLRSMAGAGAGRQLRDLQVVPDSERQLVLDGFNQTKASYPRTKLIHELFEEQAVRTPDALAVLFNGESLTYRELNARCNRAADYLIDRGVLAGEYVPILIPRSTSMLIGQIAVLKAGGVYVPVDPSLPTERLLFIFRDCGATHVVTDQDEPRQFKTARYQWINVAENANCPRDIAVSSPRPRITTPLPAYVMYTSGSTGLPKGVIVPHHAVNRLVINNGYVRIAPTDRLAHCSNPAFDASTFEIWGALLNGASVLIVPQSVLLEGREFSALLEQQGVTILWLTIGLLSQYLEMLSGVLGQLNYLLTGGDIVEPTVVREILQHGPPKYLINAYGPTECTTFTATYLIQEVDQRAKSVPIGKPISNSYVIILDQNMEPVPLGVAGEIYIGGEGLALGYLNRPELTAERFVADPFSGLPGARLYRSGDVGRWRSDGIIEFLGRRDQQVKLRGYRIELGEIESNLLEHVHVKEAAVLAREDVPGEKRLVAYAVADIGKLKALSPEESGDSGKQIVGQWKTLYEETYSVNSLSPTFVGWNSSYTRQPIPEEEMKEWLQSTLLRIRALEPRKVLEIGCGVGLLLQHLAPVCEVYRGIDFSEEAIRRVASWIETRPDLQHVELERSSALEFRQAPSDKFDTVILNSVVQYFPDIVYLSRVIERAVRSIIPGGRVFVGDVRHFGLLKPFHSSVQLERASAGTTARQLRGRVARAMERDKELVIAPRFFAQLSRGECGFEKVQVLLKRGQHANELTRYRFDAILDLNDPYILPEKEIIEWGSSGKSVPEVFERLEAKRRSLLILGVGNARLDRDLMAARLLDESEDECTASELRELIGKLRPEGEDPETFWRFGESHGYEVRVSWDLRYEDGKFNVELIDSDRICLKAHHQLRRSFGLRLPEETSVFANDPLAASLQQEVISRLRDYLKLRLPPYMVPSAFVMLNALPLNSNGKVDRSALPVPDNDSYVGRQYEPPQGEVEETLALVWQELLRVESVGRQDSFFELGGHSLLMVQMLERLRRRGLSATVRNVYANPVLADLGRTLASTAGEGFVSPNLIPNDCDSLDPSMITLIQLEPVHIARISQETQGGAKNIQDIYPLAPLQDAILFHHLLHQHRSDVFVLSLLLEMSSRERLDTFLWALKNVIDRHDILRTSILWENLPAPVQVVSRRLTLHIEELVLDRNSDLLAQLLERMTPEPQGIKLSHPPLMQLQTTSDTQTAKCYLILKLHHLICDHESLQTMLAEVTSYIDQRAHELPKPVPYRNHVAQVLASVRADDAEQFFRRKLQGIEASTAPFGLLDVRGDGSCIDEARVALESNLARRLRTEARRKGVTAATLFHAAWALVVARTSGRDDVVFGTVVLGRMHGSAGAQQTLGLFINTLALRLRLRGVASNELVQQTQRELIELLAYEQVSLAIAQSCSDVKAPTPLFTTLLNYRHSSSNTGAEFPSSAGVAVVATWDRTNFPITLSVDDLGEGFELTAQTDRRIGPQRVVSYMRAALAALVDAIEFSSEVPALTLSVLPPIELHKLVRTFNTAENRGQDTRLAHSWFEMQVKVSPRATAVRCGTRSATYAELNSNANQLALRLRDRQVGFERVVGVCVRPSVEMVAAVLAILKAGCVYLPIDPAYPPDRLAYILNDTEPCVVLTERSLLARISDTKAEIILLDETWNDVPAPGRAAPDLEPFQMSPKQLAYVVYTSGSTGLPKGVAAEHGSLANRIVAQSDIDPFSNDDICCQKTPVAFVDAIFEILGPLSYGRPLIIASESERIDNQELCRMIEREGVTRLITVPALAQSLLDAGVLPRLQSLRRWTLSGETLLPGLLQSLKCQLPGCIFMNLYGSSEVGADVTHYRCDGGDLANVPIGRPVPNVQIYVLDSNLQPAPIGVTGEIFVGGSGVARGYLHKPSWTAKSFIADPFTNRGGGRLYKTGDLGRWRSDGILEYVGRNDRQVKVRGFRIELEEIEAQLIRHRKVKEAIVVAIEDVSSNNSLVAYVTARDAAVAPDAEELRSHLLGCLSDYMIPSAFVTIQAFPLTHSGKVDRRALPVPDARSYVSHDYFPPEGQVEKMLADMWVDLLPVERVGRNDNFFELGGHSLMGIRLIAKISERFQVDLSVTAIFRYPTLERMAKFVEARQSEAAVPENEESDLEEGMI